MSDRPQVLDVVALLENLPDAHLPHGQVGTVVEALDPDTVPVEFSDDGRAYAGPRSRSPGRWRSTTSPSRRECGMR